MQRYEKDRTSHHVLTKKNPHLKINNVYQENDLSFSCEIFATLPYFSYLCSMKKILLLFLISMIVGCQRKNYDEQKQHCISLIEQGEKYTKTAALARYKLWSEKINPVINDEQKLKETEEAYNGNCQHVKQYLDSLGTEVKVLKEASPEWYNDIIHLQASLEEHYKLLNTQSTSLDRYWGKHMILQSEIGNNIAAFKQKYMKD